MKEDSGIIRNRAKIESAVHNAKVALAVQREYGSLGGFLWSLVPGGRPVSNHYQYASHLLSLNRAFSRLGGHSRRPVNPKQLHRRI